MQGYLLARKNHFALYNPQTHKTTRINHRPPNSFKMGDWVEMQEKELKHLDQKQSKVKFDDLVPIHPTRLINLRDDIDKDIRARVAQYMLASPIGYGSRSLIVAPPKAGKTTVLTDLAQAIDTSKCHLITLLVDERPEEVTEFQDIVGNSALILASTFDQDAKYHQELAELAISRAKALASRGEDVILLVDSLTRLTRACNVTAPSQGRTGSGGLVYDALRLPKQLLGMARQARTGGSITVIATALVHTGSRLDEVIFEEFKGTGNSELVLDRDLAQAGLFPAIDIIKSGTRKDHLLWGEFNQNAQLLRQTMVSLDPKRALQLLQKIAHDKDGNLTLILGSMKS